MSPLPDLETELSDLAQRDRLRSLVPLDGSSRIHAICGGQPLLTFCSNDYLAFANHPALISAAIRAAECSGVGSGASRLVSGTLSAHHDLEHAVAGMVGLPAALLFPTGYQANLGVVTSLAGPNDLIVSDQANHASIIDGCRLARSKVVVYRHADSDAALDALRTPGSYRRRLLITESLFSMDGDRAPLAALSTHTQAQGATLIVDEAHALGVLGPQGRGLCQETGIVPDVLVGTLGKAFGSFGGFVAGPDTLRSYFLNCARTFIYTTAPPPPAVAAALAGVTLSLSAEGQSRRDQLARNLARLHGGLSIDGPTAARGPIVPVLLGSDRRALDAARELFGLGLLVPAIRPPTVPEGTARLRVTLSAAHEPADIQRLAAALRTVLP